MPLSPGDRIGAYEILAPLGHGGMGEVYRARDTSLGRMAAIKVLPDAFLQDPERRSRFQHEAKILAALSHPNIAGVYGWEEHGATSALVMELVEGEPLDRMIPSGGLPLARVLELAIQVARGLEAAHRAGIVHRDLKPANIMVTTAGIAKLLDFGLARQSTSSPLAGATDETATATIERTAEGVIVGTIAYMSPEQVQGKPVDARSDLFSFGTTIFEMLTGRRPFLGEDRISTLSAILRDEPQSVCALAAAPPEVDRLVRRCLRKSVERRVQTAADLRAALEDLADEPPVVLPAPASRVRSRLTIPWVATPIALLALATTLVLTRREPALDPLELRQVTFESGMAVMPALSRDGKLVVYASDRAGEGTLDLWVRQTAGGDAHRLTSGIGVVSNPQFSPDGTRVLFLSGSSIFEVPALGGPSRRLLDSAGPFTVSSLGEIAFVTPRTAIIQPIQIVVAGSRPQPLRPDCLTSAPPGWSPDGQRLAFVGECNKAPGLFVVSRSGGTQVKIFLPNNLDVLGKRLMPSNRVKWLPANSRSPEALIVPVRNGDSVNLFRVGLDGATTPITQGTGHETEASVSADATIVFTRSEYYPAIWSLPLDSLTRAQPPKREAAPATLFAVSQDSAKLVFGRSVGLAKGELVSRDLASGAEAVIATHNSGGFGNFWSQISPDSNQVVYRISNSPTEIQHCLVSPAGGSPRCQSSRLALASAWRPDGTGIIGECDQGAVCEMNPSDWNVRQIVAKPSGAELLFPSYSADGRWMTFMYRTSGGTAIIMARVQSDGSLARQAECVRLSPPEIKAASRPRFTYDGKVIFYIRNEGGVQHLMRQPIDLAAGKALAEPTVIAPMQIYAGWFADSLGVPSSYIQVSRTRVYFNSVELHSNVWSTAFLK
jgi:eukaryotic-like serine/threonine-protein kinase